MSLRKATTFPTFSLRHLTWPQVSSQSQFTPLSFLTNNYSFLTCKICFPKRKLPNFCFYFTVVLYSQCLGINSPSIRCLGTEMYI